MGRTDLDEVQRRAGARLRERDGVTVAAHFGSLSAELAVCHAAVGLAVRDDLAVLELRGTPPAVGAVVQHVSGARIVPGRAHHGAAAWWCPVTAHRVLVLADRSAAAALRATLTADAGAVTGWGPAADGGPSASVIDLTDDYALLGLLGPRAELVLRDAGLLAAGALPADGAVLTGPGLVLREAGDRFLVLVPGAHGVSLWQDLSAAGRVYGIACVGHEALSHLRARPGGSHPTTVVTEPVDKPDYSRSAPPSQHSHEETSPDVQ